MCLKKKINDIIELFVWVERARALELNELVGSHNTWQHNFMQQEPGANFLMTANYVDTTTFCLNKHLFFIFFSFSLSYTSTFIFLGFKHQTINTFFYLSDIAFCKEYGFFKLLLPSWGRLSLCIYEELYPVI